MPRAVSATRLDDPEASYDETAARDTVALVVLSTLTPEENAR